MKVPNIDYLRDTKPSEIAEGLEEMRQEYRDAEQALKIAQSRLIVVNRIIDVVLNKGSEAVMEHNQNTRMNEYPPQEIIDELTEAGYETMTENNPTAGGNALRIAVTFERGAELRHEKAKEVQIEEEKELLHRQNITQDTKD